MDSDTVRNPDGASAEAYWRRRTIALGGVVATLGLIVWACSAGDEQTAERRPAENAAAQRPDLTIMPTVTVTVTTEATATVRPTESRSGNACEPRDVVVSFAATKDTYVGTDRPRFRLTAVNTGRRACTFEAGPRELEVQITSGADRLWTSAKCARGSGSATRLLLRRGVPHVATIVWDRRRASGDCTGSRPAARPGTYLAAVKADGIKVKKQVFRLR
jgi:hypothetical protein